MLRGTDISSYQSSIPKGDFAVLKATEGLTLNDKRFSSWWKSLEGKLRGAYHFAHPGNDPVAEADHFLRVVRAAGLHSGDVLVLDHEVSDGTSPVHCSSWAQAWCARVQAAVGYSPVVYTFLSFAREGRCAGLGSRPLWIADPSSAAGHPRVPAPWHTWVMHQYSEVGGIDHDIFNGNAADWRKLGGLEPAPAPTPHPSPTPTTEDDMPTGQLFNGANAATPITFKRGAYGHIGFAAGDDPKVPNRASLLVQVHDVKGWHDNALTVAAEDGQPIVKFPDPATTNIVRVVRTDGGDVPVAWEVS